jgi:7-carboxy-7-deazaguanine synthase
LKVAERFISINGEGLRAGELAVFIRFTGCNLSCSYCDTMWANENPYFEELSHHEILDYIESTGVKNVTITGGEPLLAEGIYFFLGYLSVMKDISVEIETNGSIDLKTENLHKCINRPHITMDVKCPSSGMSEYCCFDNFEVLTFRDCVKFVVWDRIDLDYALFIINKYNLTKKTNIILSPVFGEIAPEEIVQFMKNRKLNKVRLGLQLHKIIWNPSERGV